MKIHIPWQLALSGLLLLIHANSHAFSCVDTETTGVPQLECEALVALYDSTDGDKWMYNDNWKTREPVADWQGVDVEEGHVVTLRLYRNNLKGNIPIQLSQLTQLQTLVLSDNHLSGTIPAELGTLTKLYHLSLYLNDLTGSIPIALGNLSQLETLELGGNFLSGTLPTELGQLTALKRLELKGNSLSGTLPIALTTLPALQELLLGTNFFSGTIPAGLSHLPLVELELQNNQFSGTIPATLGHLANIQILDLSYNELHGEIPATLGHLIWLKRLDLSNNQLSGTIPTRLAELNITTLRFQNNQLTAFSCTNTAITGIPQAECEALVALYDQNAEPHACHASWSTAECAAILPELLGGLYQTGGRSCKNNWKTPAPITGWSGVQVLNGHVWEINWSNCGINVIPAELGQLTHLRGLNIPHNQLSTLPATFANLVALKMLDVSNNQLTSLPAELGQLTGLQSLNLSHNQLQALPVELGELSALQIFNFNHNQVTVLPTQLGNLTQLQSLEGGNNQLSGVIPAEFGNLNSLHILNLANNQLSGTVPIELSRLSHLDVLDLANNQLSGTIPAEFGYLSGLHRLILANNQLSGAIPGGFGDLTNLHTLNLANNQLNSAIPVELGNLRSLHILNLSNNQLTWRIPTELGDLKYLQLLDLSANRLTGIIPDTFHNSQQLVKLNLADNYLSGYTPSAALIPLLERMPYAGFNINYNCLQPTNATIIELLKSKSPTIAKYSEAEIEAARDPTNWGRLPYNHDYNTVFSWETLQNQCFHAAQCQLYAIHNAGLNNAQFFTIHPEVLTLRRLGDLYTGYAFAAIAIQHQTNHVYVVSGNAASQAGYVYQLDAETGELLPVGATGFSDIQDLAFSPDGILYGWANGQGIVQIELSTGQGTLIVPSVMPVNSLTISKQPNRTLFYGVISNELWRYDLEMGTLEVLCNNLFGKSEALEMLDTGELLVGSHEVSFGMYNLNPETCELILTDADFSNPFQHIEGLAMPVAACQ